MLESKFVDYAKTQTNQKFPHEHKVPKGMGKEWFFPPRKLHRKCHPQVDFLSN